MKEMTRREFLTLTGASVALLALAACGSTPPTPAVPTGKEAKVLEAINLYRGELSPLTLDSGLNKAAEEVAKMILSNKPLDDMNSYAEFDKAIAGYKNAEAYQPIGLSMNVETNKAAPRYVCQDDAKLMGEQLMAQTGDIALKQLKSPKLTLVGIHVFEYGSATYSGGTEAVSGKGGLYTMTVKDLYSAMSGIEDRYLAMADAPNKEDISMKKHSGKLRFFLIAAALVSLLGVTAYAVTAKIQLNTKRYMQGTGESVDANASVPYEAEINFQSTADTYEGLQTYCPTWLPEGYRLRFVSDKAYGHQTLHFATASDESALVLETTRGDNAADLVLESVTKGCSCLLPLSA